MPTPSADPSPLFQTGLYLAGILLGYALLTPRQEWEEAWEMLRGLWEE